MISLYNSGSRRGPLRGAGQPGVLRGDEEAGGSAIDLHITRNTKQIYMIQYKQQAIGRTDRLEFFVATKIRLKFVQSKMCCNKNL